MSASRSSKGLLAPGAAEAGKDEIFVQIQARHPRFTTALLADADARHVFHGAAPSTSRRAELTRAARALVSDPAFLALAAYRAKAALQRRGVPVLPILAHRLAMATAQVCIGDPAVIEPGVVLPRGMVVIDGFVSIADGTVIHPMVTIGLKEGDFIGATIEPDVVVGTGAQVIGPVTLGARASVLPNVVVIDDVAPGEVVGGVPARVIERAEASLGPAPVGR